MRGVTKTMSERDLYLSQFRNLNGSGPAWLRPVRAAAIERFGELGFPTTRLEDWKYTNVAPLARVPFRFDPAAESSREAARAALETAALGKGPQIVFVNGRFSSSLSSIADLPSGIRVQSLAEALDQDRGLVEPHLGRYASYDEHSFTALNTAFLTDGALVWVPRGARVAEAVQLIFISAGNGTPFVSHPRTLVVAGESSDLTVVETYVGADMGPYFTNAVTEIVLEPDARLTHYKLQRESDAAFHVARVEVHQGRATQMRTCSLSFGAALARNDINTVLDGEGAECWLDGLYLVGGAQHVDHHTSIDHRKPHGTSHELYKGVLDGRSTGVFNGKVFVRAGAQKSDARQVNKNLLLSADAVINTKPQLEILADDVRCSHGATIGRLEDDALFYLRSRGIDAAAARAWLIYAFANEIVGRVEMGPVRSQLDATLWAQFGGDFSGEAAR